MDAHSMSVAHFSNLDLWNDAAARAFGDIEVGSRGRSFEATMEARVWPGVHLVRVCSVPAHVRGAQVGGQAGCHVLCNESGTVHVRQGGHTQDLEAGEVTVLSADRPYELDFEESNRVLVASLLGRDAGRALQRPEMYRRRGDEAALVAGLLHRVQGMDAATAGRLDAGAFRAALINLLNLERPAQSLDVPGRALSCDARRWLRVRSIVDTAPADAAVNAAYVAAALGLSVRSVQSLFERHGTTVAAFVLQRRLQRVALQLRAQPDRRIAALAYDGGFGDLSHFCRTFRQQFGCTAREWRQQH